MKSAPVPMTDDIFMQENKTRLSDGLHYFSRRLGTATAKNREDSDDWYKNPGINNDYLIMVLE